MVSSLQKQGVSPRTIIDAGANAGQFAVASAKLFPNATVHSFEPLPDCIALLEKHATKLGNIVVYPVGLGRTAERATFHVNSHSHSSSFLPLAQAHLNAFPSAVEARTLQVEVSTLDKALSGVEFASPVLLKLDVQGTEPDVLAGGSETLRRVDYVLLEASFKMMYEGELLFEDIVSLMKGLGFKFLRPVGWLAGPKTGEILQMDILFQKIS